MQLTLSDDVLALCSSKSKKAMLSALKSSSLFGTHCNGAGLRNAEKHVMRAHGDSKDVQPNYAV